MSRIVVLGDLNLDVYARRPVDLERGEEARDAVRAVPGGSAGTFARTAARCGGAVTFLGCVGTDLVGDLLVRSLEEAGVRALVQRTARPSGVILSLEEGDERTMVCSRGANDGIRADRIDPGVFDDAAHLHLSGYAFLSPAQRAAVGRSVGYAHRQGLSISVDPPPANLIRSHGVRAFLDRMPDGTWLFPNRAEGEVLAGTPETRAIVDRLEERFPVGVLTLGVDGSLAWAGETQNRLSVAPLEFVDTTGAGDAFAGAFVAAYLETRDLAHAHRVAGDAARRHLAPPGPPAS